MNITHAKVQPFPRSPPLHHPTLIFSSGQKLPFPRKFITAHIGRSSSFASILCKKHTLLAHGCFGVSRSRIRSSVSEVEEEQKQKSVVVKRAYPFNEIEPKWQRYWEENRTFRTPDDVDTSKPKYYVLDMFPYPSGAGLHVGHPLGYTATDILARFKRMQGYNVLHPMGWDAFGLPAEQYAIETGTHPKLTTLRNINRFRSQLKLLGFSYDWDREISTIEPEYYKWTQWIFLQLLKRGLAYQVLLMTSSEFIIPIINFVHPHQKPGLLVGQILSSG